MLKFSFDVGKTEFHNIEFYFNQFWGNLYIKDNGTNIHKTVRFMSFSLTKVYEFNVGKDEIHNIKIELIRKLLLAGFREYLGKVFVDGALINEYRGNISWKEVSFK